MMHVRSLHNFIQLNFKFIIKFVRFTLTQCESHKSTHRFKNKMFKKYFEDVFI
jgi:hypothetical protein